MITLDNSILTEIDGQPKTERTKIGQTTASHRKSVATKGGRVQKKSKHSSTKTRSFPDEKTGGTNK